MVNSVVPAIIGLGGGVAVGYMVAKGLEGYGITLRIGTLTFDANGTSYFQLYDDVGTSIATISLHAKLTQPLGIANGNKLRISKA